jgi:hypothetical protein
MSALAFVAAWGGAVWAALSLRTRIRLLRRIGLGRHEEDLEKARAITRQAFQILTTLVVAVIVAIALGERWAAEWRSSIIGQAVLAAFAIALVACSIWTFIYTVRQQWSRNGSHRGMILGVLVGFIEFGLLALMLHWLSSNR